MDPDMVRQQEEAEAAARLHAVQPQPLIPPSSDSSTRLPPKPALLFAPQTELDSLGTAISSIAGHSTQEVTALSPLGPPPALATPDRAASMQQAAQSGALEHAQLPPVLEHVARLQQAAAPPFPLSTSGRQLDVMETGPLAVEPDLAMPSVQVCGEPISERAPQSVSKPVAQQRPILMPTAEQPASAVLPHPAQQLPERTTHHIGSWIAALYCTAFAGAGIAGGIFAAAQLQLAATQGAAIGIAAGFVLGWLSAAARLRSQEASASVAFQAPLLPAVFVVLVEFCAVYVASSVPSAYPVNAQAFSAEIAAAGGILAYILALIGIYARIQSR